MIDMLTALAESAPAPAAAIAVVHEDTDVAVTTGTADVTTGEAATPNHWWDLASLTKVLVAAPAVLALADGGNLTLDEPLGRQWPRASGTWVGSATPAELLSFRGGFPATLDLREKRGDLVDQVLQTAPDHDQDVALYSDVGFLALGFAVEDITGKSLASLVQTRGPLRYSTVDAPLPGPAVATELCAWRGQLVVGAVHDENAAVLGGVAGHAGAFAQLSGLVEMLSAGLADPRTAPPRHVGTSAGGDRYAHGWQLTPDERGFGATGFVGNRLYIAPDDGYSVLILANRIHPSRGTDRVPFTAWTDTVLARVAERVAGPS